MTNNLTPFQQELMDTAEEWADASFDNAECGPEVEQAKTKFIKLVKRAIDSDALQTWEYPHPDKVKNDISS